MRNIDHHRLRFIIQSLSREEPIGRVPAATAAVAVVIGLDDAGEDSVLLIRRSDRVDDPWSGHIALPGGRVQASDTSFVETATRETWEEVGIQLTAGEFLGYMAPVHARTKDIQVVPSVFAVEGTPPVSAGPEVASSKWVSLRTVSSPQSRSVHLLTGGGREALKLPALELDGYHVWGVTERILSALVESANRDRSTRVR